MKDILVTGGSRGIGLEFSKQFLEKGYQVFAASRNPFESQVLQKLKTSCDDRLLIYELDVGEEKSRIKFFQWLSEKTNKLDILINNAGILSGNEEFNFRFGELNQADLCKTLLINSVAPLMMVEGLVQLLEHGNQPIIANITSDNGSIALKNSRGKYGYSASKAALNMITKILSIELAQREIIVVSLHPGWVKTTMTQNENAPLNPSESIKGMIEIIDSLELKDSGRFLDWRGNEIAW